MKKKFAETILDDVYLFIFDFNLHVVASQQTRGVATMFV